MAKMQDVYVAHAVSLCVFRYSNRNHVGSTLKLSVLLPIIRFINYRFIPPFTQINDCNNMSVNEQPDIAGVRQLFIVPVRSLFTWIVCCGLFCLHEVGGYLNR